MLHVVAMTLDRAALAVPVVVRTATGAPDVRRRLGELGLRRGATVTCLRRTSGGGRLLDVAGTRVAVGADVLSAIEIEDVRG